MCWTALLPWAWLSLPFRWAWLGVWCPGDTPFFACLGPGALGKGSQGGQWALARPYPLSLLDNAGGFQHELTGRWDPGGWLSARSMLDDPGLVFLSGLRFPSSEGDPPCL